MKTNNIIEDKRSFLRFIKLQHVVHSLAKDRIQNGLNRGPKYTIFQNSNINLDSNQNKRHRRGRGRRPPINRSSGRSVDTRLFKRRRSPFRGQNRLFGRPSRWRRE